MEPASLAQLGAPVLFRTDYKREGGLRAGYGEKQDAQATAFFVAFVDNATASQLRPDSEVADYRWKPLRELDHCNESHTFRAWACKACNRSRRRHPAAAANSM